MAEKEAKKTNKKSVAKSSRNNKKLPTEVGGEIVLEQNLDEFRVTSRKTNEMVGVFYITLALLIFSGLLIEQSGYVRNMARHFVEVNGIGPIFLALFCIYSGMKRLRGNKVFIKSSQIVAFPFMYFTFIGFVSSLKIDGTPEMFLGGIVGSYIFWYLRELLGHYSAAIVLFSTFLSSMMHVTDVYVSDILNGIVKFSRFALDRTVTGVMALAITLRNVTWFCLRETHLFLCTLIHDLIVLVEKGVYAFVEMFFPGRQAIENKLKEEESLANPFDNVQVEPAATAQTKTAAEKEVEIPVEQFDMPKVKAVKEESVTTKPKSGFNKVKEEVEPVFDMNEDVNPFVKPEEKKQVNGEIKGKAHRNLRTAVESTMSNQKEKESPVKEEKKANPYVAETPKEIVVDVEPVVEEKVEKSTKIKSIKNMLPFLGAKDEKPVEEQVLVTEVNDEVLEQEKVALDALNQINDIPVVKPEPVRMETPVVEPVVNTVAEPVIKEAAKAVEQPTPQAVPVVQNEVEVEMTSGSSIGSTVKTPDFQDMEKVSEETAGVLEEEQDVFFTNELPGIDFLAEPPENMDADSEDELWSRGGRLIQALETYKVNAVLDSFTQGPTITRFELRPEAGTKLSKIVGLTNEIAMALAAKSVRIEAPIPGTSKVGIEIPNEKPVPVHFKEIVSAIKGEGTEDMHPLSIAFGKDISGEAVIGNLAKMPHVLVAGATGSGKSVCINTIISSILFRARPDQVKFVMVDPKQVELAIYRGIPHLITDVVTNPEEASAALQWGVVEMEKRYSLLSSFGVRHIDTFNQKIEEGTLEPIEEVESIPTQKLPYVVMIVDELADLMMVAKKDVETSICRIAQKARAVGIHLVIATQRPSVDVITGLIKANLPSRIAFMVNSGIDSKTILNTTGAENLLGRGDALYYPAGQNKPDRIQGAFVSDDEVTELVRSVKDIFGPADYEDIVSQFMEPEEDIEDVQEFYDDKYNMALEVALREQYVSTSMLQRHLGIGYNRAARIVDVFYARGICGSQESGKKRKVMITWEEIENYKL
jgi:S-DNA-T family DNA segregation ATPase FtsK/SpoIIIE